MNKLRLTQLADYLETVPDELFDFEYTCEADSLAQLVAMCRREPDCGATACALGHMPCIWPNEFKWERRAYAFQGENQWRIVRKDIELPDGVDHPQDWFEITTLEFYYLFDWNNGNVNHIGCLRKDASLQDVINRIRQVIADGFPQTQETI